MDPAPRASALAFSASFGERGRSLLIELARKLDKTDNGEKRNIQQEKEEK
jgi:hypothetical protein